MEIIGFCGVIGSGKDYRCKEYVEKGYTRIAFADPLRELCYATVGWKTTDSSHYELFKSNYWNPIYKKIDAFNGRDLLERLGKHIMFMFGEDIWVKLLEKKIENENIQKVVIPDVRYKEEIKSILNKNGKIFFCNYKSLRYEIRKTKPEQLAQLLIAKGFKDGDDVTQFLSDFIKDGEL